MSWLVWSDPTAIAVADVIRVGCLIAGLGFAGVVGQALRNPRMKAHPTFRGFRWQLFGLALGVTLVVVLQYERLNDPVHVLTLPLSVLFLGVSYYSVALPLVDARSDVEHGLEEM